MASITPDQIAIYGTVGIVIILIIIIYFTRATRRRIVGALAGGLAGGLVIALTDYIAFSLGLWYYPDITVYTQLSYYVPAALLYGSGMALIGWRINRKFGIKGLMSFILLFGVYGSIRDFIVAATSSGSVLTYGPGFVPVIGDYLAWVGLLIIAQIAMWFVAGPAKNDRLARTKT
ncbi:MAG TPA: hypothetical protein VK426_02080 [Methanobacterium sp.]|nr:hypothetical protein [Methanobacterium sp.]